jgi:hypothetical protein
VAVLRTLVARPCTSVPCDAVPDVVVDFVVPVFTICFLVLAKKSTVVELVEGVILWTFLKQCLLSVPVLGMCEWIGYD